MAHLDKKVEFAEQENIEDCKAFRTGSMGDKEQRMSRFRRLTSGSLRHKRQAGHMTTTKTDLIDPTHCIDPLHTFFNSDTEVSDSGVPRINNTAYMNNGRRPKRYRRSCRSAYETPNYSTALGPLREKHKLTPLERIFLEAAERGDKSTLVRCLSFSNGVNVNCVNILGRTAIQIAVDNENIELVELLLEQPGIEIGDAILYAIQEGVYRIVEMLIDHPSITKEMLGTSWTTQCIGIGKREEESHDFSTDISPVMLAAICNQFEILQLLINRGARIEEPHKSSCSCEHCHRLLSDDPLKHTLQRINTYRALASPAWMSLTSPDPILTAFELSSELLHLASRENEFKEIFLSLCEQCRKYACDLLDLCRGTGEVVAVLSKGTDSDESCSDVSGDESDDTQGASSVPNISLPINHISINCHSSSCPHQQGSHDNGDASNCSQCENNNQNYAANENDWRELLDRSNFSRRRHHRRFTAWNHSSYSCAKFNQALSLESQHSINEDFVGTDNLHPSTSKTEYLNYTDKSINDGEQLKIAVSHTASYSTAKFPSCIAKEKRNFQDFTSDNNDCNNIGETDDKSKAVTKETILNEGLPSTTNTSEGCSSIFFERKRNSFDWESATSGFNQRVQLNTGIDTTHCKHGLYKRNSFSNPNNIICCCFPHYRCCKCSKSQTKKDLSLNRHSEKKHLKSETSEIESFGVKKHRKFYSFKLDRLKLAIKHEQKKFVAHPHCQHLLTTLWYDQLPGWRKRHPFTKLFLCFCFIIALPILAPTYLIHPHGCIGQLMRSPLIKFINHSASFAIFIFLLLIASTDTLTQTDLQIRSQIRGPDPNVIEMLILWWVIGFVWSEMKQIWEEGLKAYVRQWWNWLDFLMLGLYLTTVALRVVAVLLRKTNHYGTESLPRNQWPTTDPTLLSEALFSIAHIFSFARIIFLFQINEHLGPLQISLGNMLIDITKFIFIFLLVISSFACGLHQLYYYYLSPGEDNRPRAFSSLVSSYRTLFWHLFGSSQAGNFEVTFVNKTSGERERMESARNTMVVGEILLLIYHAMAIIVLVNMLIAMMSNSFQTIQNHADTEWKFARSKLWVGYFDEGSTLPPPLNTIVSPKSIIRCLYGVYHLFVLLIRTCLNCKQTTNASTKHKQNKEVRQQTKPSCVDSQFSHKSNQLDWDIEIQETNAEESIPNANMVNKQKQQSVKEIKRSKRKTYYQTVMRRLVRRYIHQSKKTMRQDGVNEDDLLEIKQDISSLRFELREDRKREIVRAVCQLESLKQELVDELSRQNSILQNAVLPNSPCTTSYHDEDKMDNCQKLLKLESSTPLLVNSQTLETCHQTNMHNSTTNIATDRQLTSCSSMMNENRKKYSLNYDKETNDIYKDIIHMTSVNDISADFSQMIGQSKRQTTKRLFINDWDQFKSEIRSELREELSLLLKNKSVVFHMEKSASETESNNNSILIPYTSSNSLLNENISTTSQNTIHTKNSTHRTSRTQDTAQPSNIQKRHSRQTDNNNDCNMNSERLKLLHSRYSEIFEGDLSPKMPSTPVELLSCSTSSSPSTLMEALISSPMIHGKCTTLGTSRIMQDINVPTSPSTLPITSDVSYSGIRKPRKQKDEKMPDDKKGRQKRTSIHEVRGVREEDSSSTLK